MYAGEIKGTIHRKVLEVYSSDDLMAGSVLVLRQARLMMLND